MRVTAFISDRIGADTVEAEMLVIIGNIYENPELLEAK
jgi:hypothetical protein